MKPDEIFAAVRDSYNEAVKADKALLALWDKAEKGAATYADADKYAVKIGKAMAKALDDGLAAANLPDGIITEEVAQAIIPKVTAGTEKTVAGYAKRVQQATNKRAGIGVGVVDHRHNASRVDGLVKHATDRAFEDIREKLGQNVVNYTQSVVTGTMRANIEAQESIGIKATIVRTYDGVGLHSGKEPCYWCIDRAGVWDYDQARDNGVFERHDGCGCTITYEPEGGDKQLQTNWRNNEWETV